MERLRRDSQIRTDRCIIRPPRHGDYTAWATLRSESRAFLEPWEPRWPGDALTPSDWKRRMRAWRSGWAADKAYVFLIFERSSARLVGGASLSHVRRGPAMMASLGYWLGKWAEGHGFMAEAVEAVCGWAADILELERIEAATVPENVRSQKVLDRCGFEREGYARAYLEIAGKRRDHVLFARTIGDGGDTVPTKGAVR
ncbi:MAG: GNAT family protein [Pseudomonadota bacterium]